MQLALRYLGEEGQKLPGWDPSRKPLPVRIVLRQFAAWLPEGVRRGDAGRVWDYIEHQLGAWGCKEAYPKLKRDLEEGRGIVLFDGLDEVSERDEANKRTVIKEAIVAFAGPLAATQIVVTSRNYAYRRDDAWRLPEEQFPVVELALFSRRGEPLWLRGDERQRLGMDAEPLGAVPLSRPPRRTPETGGPGRAHATSNASCGAAGSAAVPGPSAVPPGSGTSPTTTPGTSVFGWSCAHYSEH